jgi:hypothetical protein
VAPTIPDVLYKYVLPERIDILLQKRIRFTQPCFLNDPFEFKPGAPEADDIGHFEAKVAKLREDDYRDKSALYGVLSLTPKKDSIPMWTHYAASHRGFVIGFDTRSGPFLQAIEEGRLRLVTYSAERVNVTRGLPEQSWADPDTIFHSKSTDWDYEQEWRWLESRAPGEYADLVSGSNGELLFLRRIPAESIREIVLGCRADSSLIESVRALQLTPSYRHLKLFKVALNPSRYILDVVVLA